jgi:undecaprenyl-diphosphatase
MGPGLYEYFYGHGSVNERLFLFVNHATSPFLDAVMPVVTRLGDPRFVYLYLGLLLLSRLAGRNSVPGRYPAVYIIAAILSLVTENLLKDYFHVPRPPVAIGPDKVRLLGHLSHSFSLPSGHAVFSFMTATVIGYGRGVGWKLFLLPSAMLVAWSRIYLGVHYPLDVLSGAVVGIVYGLVCWKAYEWGERIVGKRRENSRRGD